MAKKFLLGLDLGTDSVGWCLTDEGNHIVHKGGKSLWGVRLFDEAQDCKSRRMNRQSRRRINRRGERVDLLQSLFANDILAVDRNFFVRLNNAFYHPEDKDISLKGEDNTLFANVGGLNDKAFYEKYPTIYHLRYALIRNDDKADIRLFYLALHHMIKYRGNFLHEGETFDSKGGEELVTVFSDISKQLSMIGKDPLDFGKDFVIRFRQIAEVTHGITDLKTALVALFHSEEKYVNKVLIPLISGGKVKVTDVFDLDDEEEGSLDVKSFSVRDDSFDENICKLQSHFSGRSEFELIIDAKKVSDFIVLTKVLGNSTSISEAMVARYKKHSEDLKALKHYVREKCPDKYFECFRKVDSELCNYPHYVGMNSVKGRRERFAHCSVDSFYSFLKDHIFGLKNADKTDDKFVKDVYARMSDGDYLPKQNSSDNGVFPYQLNLVEMEAIIKKQSRYYSFLEAKDQDGLTGHQKLISILTYRLPYYVGPLMSHLEGNARSNHSWVVRSEKKIYPWNYKEVVDLHSSAELFIKRMLNKCTYIPNADCLPKFSLSYSLYEVVSFLNNIAINGRPLPFDKTPGEVSKQEIIEEFFKVKPVSKKSLVSYLKGKLGSKFTEDSLSFIKGGTIETVDCSLRSHQDFVRIFGLDFVLSHKDTIEKMILDLSVFTDRAIVKERLHKNYHLTNENQIRSIASLPYSGFGRLSRELLELTSPHLNKETGEILEIKLLDAMLISGKNLVEILSDREYRYGEIVATLKKEAAPKLSEGSSKLSQVKDYVEGLYVSPNMKRPLIQAYEIIDEIQKIIEKPIDEYYIECARGGKDDERGKSKPSRLQSLLKLYDRAKEETRKIIQDGESSDPDLYRAAASSKANLDECYGKLEGCVTGNQALQFRSDKLYFYYVQLGRCLYSLKPIPLDELYSDESKFDIDHIVPQAKVKDDSLANRALVFQDKNRDKKDIYPFVDGFLAPGARAFYRYLHRIGLMEDKKYDELTRLPGNPLREDEIAQFANRQLVSTNQSVIGLINVINAFEKTKNGATPKIVYSKAGLVSDFRSRYDLLKARDANSYHHAHDAYLNIVVGRAMDCYFGYRPSESELERIDWLVRNGYSTNPSKIFDDVSEKSRQNGKEKKPIVDSSGNVVWKCGETIKEIEKNIYRRFDIMVSVRQFVKPGLFGKISIHPAADDKGGNLFPIKKGLDTAKYGGYSDLTNGFFSLLEEDQGKKGSKARLLPIPNIYAKPDDEKSILDYATNVVGLKIKSILIPCLRVNSIVDFGSKKVCLTGKHTDSDSLVSSLVQIRFSKEEIGTIRSISKFNEVILGKIGKGLKPFEPSFDDEFEKFFEVKNRMGSLVISPAANETKNKAIFLTREEEQNLYDTLKKKLQSDFYTGIGGPANAGILMGKEEALSNFSRASTAVRAVILHELLKLTMANSSVNANLFLLGGAKISPNRHLANVLSCCRIIAQSVTGYYDKVLWESK